MKIEIQQRLEEAEGRIREYKEGVNEYEREVNQYKGELKKEGEFQSLTVKSYSTTDYNCNYIFLDNRGL